MNQAYIPHTLFGLPHHVAAASFAMFLLTSAFQPAEVHPIPPRARRDSTKKIPEKKSASTVPLLSRPSMRPPRPEGKR
jgi:hypothetical protein